MESKESPHRERDDRAEPSARGKPARAPGGSAPPAVEISVLVPLWNHAKEAPHVYERVASVLASLGRSFEILFVDDGSTDGTFEVLERLHRRDPRVSVVKLDRNYGQHPALAAAIELARGRILITMDADLQGDPAEIPRFIERIEEGYDLVSGCRIGRKAPFFSRRLPSMLVNRLIGAVTGVKLRDYGAGMNALTRELGAQFNEHGDRQRFLKPLATSLARRIAEVEITDRRSQQEHSRYNLLRLFGLLLDLVISFSAMPFRLVGCAGFVLVGVGGLGTLGYVVARLAGMAASDRLQVLVLLCVFFGVQLVIVGLLGEFVVRIYHLQQRRPLFRVETHLSSSGAGDRMRAAETEGMMVDR